MTQTDLNPFALVEVIAPSFTLKNPCPAPIPAAPITRQHTKTPKTIRPGQSITLVQLLFANKVLTATCPYVQSHFLPVATFSRAPTFPFHCVKQGHGLFPLQKVKQVLHTFEPATNDLINQDYGHTASHPPQEAVPG